tara:strand:+ start:604 stop:732 length:129 start_codon:yes stop_codon:yes gene_type:complete
MAIASKAIVTSMNAMNTENVWINVPVSKTGDWPLNRQNIRQT